MYYFTRVLTNDRIIEIYFWSHRIIQDINDVIHRFMMGTIINLAEKSGFFFGSKLLQVLKIQR